MADDMGDGLFWRSSPKYGNDWTMLSSSEREMSLVLIMCFNNSFTSYARHPFRTSCITSGTRPSVT